MKIAKGVLRREGLRLFRRLQAPDHFLAQLVDDPETGGLFVPRNRWQRAVMTVDWGIVEALHRADLLQLESRKKGNPALAQRVYIISASGKAWWRRETGGENPFQKQHQLRGHVTLEEPGRGMVRRDVNQGESPLGWLRRRRDKSGAAYLSEVEADAGEQLRRDFTFAQLGARTTLNWDGMLAHVDSSGAGDVDRVDVSAHVLDARRRVERALAHVGPGLADVVVETCCHLNGLEQAERELGWPQRSGKVVLKIALTRLPSITNWRDHRRSDEGDIFGKRLLATSQMRQSARQIGEVRLCECLQVAGRRPHVHATPLRTVHLSAEG